MRLDVFRRELADHRRSLVGCGVGGLLLVALYVFLYPSIKSSGAGVQQLLNTLPKGFRTAFIPAGVSYLSPPGYLGTELFSAIVPVLLLVMGVLAGSRALAGEEQNGTIDLLLSTPVRRTRLAVEKACGALTPLFVVAAAIWLAIVITGPSQGIVLSLGNLTLTVLAVALLGVGFGMLAFLVASATGSVGIGGGSAAALAVAMYALSIVGSLVPWLTGFANAVSPFHWTAGSAALTTGVSWSGMLLLIVCPIVLLGASMVLYERRDLVA
jgi:ABC-2 type transport system permease protein